MVEINNDGASCKFRLWASEFREKRILCWNKLVTLLDQLLVREHEKMARWTWDGQRQREKMMLNE